MSMAAPQQRIASAHTVFLGNYGALTRHARQRGVSRQWLYREAARVARTLELGACINSALRMQQARHRKLPQGLVDRKRLYGNSHTFRTGRRRGTSP
jgi:hypothetical protein